MRMMGRNSVEYHRATVLERADDHPGLALEYYASRGETPLVWGGSGAQALGLSGPVTPVAYQAIYGPGGAADPTTGTRLVSTTRPGMELVISAHKSVAELGVLGRAEDMHKIMDAERHATLSYLDQVTRDKGGRRGRAAVATPTGGLIYAHARHATSRAGDPCPHDHVLLANVAEMADEAGGWKAPDTTLWREHLHAATMVGRLASAKVAVDLGYAIQADPGPSGRLGHWRIAGIPQEVLDIHSKRAAEIEAECARTDNHSYQARNVAARATRKAKRHQPEGLLMSQWRAELESAGHALTDLVARVDAASREQRPIQPLTKDQGRRLVADVLDPQGTLATRKVFGRKDVVVAMAPHLYGQDPAILEPLVSRTLADPEAIPLIGVSGGRDKVYSVAHVLATEAAIAEMLATQLERSDAPVVPVEAVVGAVRTAEQRCGQRLNADQARAVSAICSSGRGAELVVGVAGSGKTTMLGVVTDAFEQAGYEVLGTATSGQAARNLGRKAGIGSSRTLASLTWRLDHGQISLSERSLVICDEVGMTEDLHLARLLAHTQASGAKLVLLGDHLQLGPVGPGGALGALVARHPGAVHRLEHNLRQQDPAEAQALGALRAGNLDEALTWYVGQDRIRTAPTRDEALQAAADAWAADLAQGKEVALLAWRRANVDELNARARAHMTAAGRLSGPEVVAPGGRCYRSGDQVVTLAPGAEGRLVTSQRGTVVLVEPDAQALVLRMDDQAVVRLGGEDISAERLAHGYATTVHRSQGATVDRAHVYADGGGRELGYVAMSRARQSSHAYLVADDVDQATDDLRRDWGRQLRPTWAIDSGLPDEESLTNESLSHLAKADRVRLGALVHARLQMTRDAVMGAVPADPRPALVEAKAALSQVRQARADLEDGRGAHQHTQAGQAARELAQAIAAQRDAKFRGTWAQGWRDRRQVARQMASSAQAEAHAQERWDAHAGPEAARLEAEIARCQSVVEDLETRHERRSDAIAANNHRFYDLCQTIRSFRDGLEAHRDRMDGVQRPGTGRKAVVRTRLSRGLEHSRRYDIQPDRSAGRGLGR